MDTSTWSTEVWIACFGLGGAIVGVIGVWIKTHRPVVLIRKVGELSGQVDKNTSKLEEVMAEQRLTLSKIYDLTIKLGEVSDVAEHALEVAVEARDNGKDLQAQQNKHLIESAGGFGRIDKLEAQIDNLLELHKLSKEQSSRERLEILSQLSKMEERSENRMKELRDSMNANFLQLNNRSDATNTRLDTLAERRAVPRG